MNARLTGIILLALVGFYGCTSTPTAESTAAPAGTEAQATEPATAAGTEQTPAPAPATSAVSPLRDPNSPLYKKVFYFPFDSSEIASADRDLLAAHGKFLAANPNVRLVIEGHCDERGTREYNLALGERRAQAVQRVIQLQGAGQGKAVSYGEERPAAQGHNESAWRLNRRVELVYSGF